MRAAARFLLRAHRAGGRSRGHARGHPHPLHQDRCGWRPVFCLERDLHGHSDVYDEPPGSLQLLPLWGFCDAEDPVYQNTVRQIRAPGYAYSFAGSPIAEIGCPHAPHPWLLSVANSLLCGRVEHSVEILRRVQMDNGIACESVDEVTANVPPARPLPPAQGSCAMRCAPLWKGGNNIRNDVCWKDWMIWPRGRSGRFSGEHLHRQRPYGGCAGTPPATRSPGRCGRACFWPVCLTIKPGITDFIHLPTPVWHRILADGRPVAPVGSVRRTLDLACGPQPDAVPCQLPAQAREHARRMNSAGGRYPSMASYDGSEQCESWDIGASEVHVTADVVYALDL